MARIALMSVPLHGHVHPMLGLAAELVERGHDVTFASGEEFTDLVTATGARAVGYASRLRSTRTGTGEWLSAAELGPQVVGLFAAEREAALEPLARAYEAEGLPHVVVFDQVTGVAPALAARWQVPTVQFSPTHVLSADQQTHGGALDAAPCLVALPQTFQFPFDDLPANTHFVGPLDWQREEPGSWSGQRRHVLVSLGTTFNERTDVVRTVAAAVAETCPEHDVVVALGRPVEGEDAEGWPAQVRLEAWVPQQDVLRSADLFVTAGGTGSVLEGIRTRTPLVVLPQVPEQMLNAHQVVAHGLGTASTEARPTAAQLAGTVRAALELPGYTAAAEQMNRAIEEAGGAPRAAQVVEGVLATERVSAG